MVDSISSITNIQIQSIPMATIKFNQLSTSLPQYCNAQSSQLLAFTKIEALLVSKLQHVSLLLLAPLAAQLVVPWLAGDTLLEYM